MLHGLGHPFLYSAGQINCQFKDDLGKIVKGDGTAFFILVNKIIYLVTNRHVIDLQFSNADKYKNFSLAKIELWGRFSGDELRGCEVLIGPNKLIFSRDELNDFVCIRAPTVLSAPGAQLVVDHCIPEEMIATEREFQDELSVCDLVAFPGYPEWYDEVERRPIFRVGTIASDPRTNYSYKRRMGDCVAYEAFSYSGSSGSSVFAMQRGIQPGYGLKFSGFRPPRFIGINAGHLPSATSGHSGLSYFFKSSAILKAISEA